MGYVFDAMTKAGRVKRPSARRRAVEMPEIETVALTPTLIRPPAETLEQAADEAAASLAALEPLPAPLEPAIAAPPPPAVVAPQPVLPETIEHIDGRLVAMTRPDSAVAEEYRTIRTHLLVRYQQRRHLIHAFTSAVRGEGATITAINLGFAFSEMPDRSTLILEANLRTPSFDRLLGIPGEPGLVHLLRGEAKLEDVTRTIGRANLSVIAAGGVCRQDAVQMLSSVAFSDLIHSLRHRYDHVVIDVAPALQLADAGLVGALSDDTTLIVRSGGTPRPLIDEAIRHLRSHNVPLGGVVLTAAQPTPARFRYEGK